jgi:hypothetical protein
MGSKVQGSRVHWLGKALRQAAFGMSFKPGSG